jgi:predicted dienelactone hydrolase
MRRSLATALTATAVALMMTVTGGALAGTTEPVRPASDPVPPPGPALPVPTGPHPVGVSVLHLVDAAREDPWVPGRPRELMVSVWYPARTDDGDLMPYATAEESRLTLRELNITGVPDDVLTTVRTHARVEPPPARRTAGRRPLVVLSPGFNHPRWFLTGVAEDLASRGYVVAGVDHTYEAPAVTFPDGRVARCVFCRDSVPRPDFPTVAGHRVRDVSFVLDRLTGPRPAWRHASIIDSRRIAMVGHSMGGAAAVRALSADPRVRAAVNLDGTLQPTLTADVHRPVLLFGAEERRPENTASWTRSWPHLTGWARWLTVVGTTHSSFTDLAPLGAQAGIAVQPLDGAVCAEITRAYVAAFLDRHLRHRPQPLLDGPSPRYPAVRFEAPDAG